MSSEMTTFVRDYDVTSTSWNGFEGERAPLTGCHLIFLSFPPSFSHFLTRTISSRQLYPRASDDYCVNGVLFSKPSECQDLPGNRSVARPAALSRSHPIPWPDCLWQLANTLNELKNERTLACRFLRT